MIFFLFKCSIKTSLENKQLPERLRNTEAYRQTDFLISTLLFPNGVI